MYRPSLCKDCTAAGSFYHSLFMSELLIYTIKRVKYVLTQSESIKFDKTRRAR